MYTQLILPLEEKIKEIESIFILTNYGDSAASMSRIDFDTIEEAQDYLLDRLHMYGDIFVTYKETTHYTEKYRGRRNSGD